jgi:bifunctional non-homologous end joining protein LigD
VAFQRKKSAAIGAKAPFPGFIEPALASSINKVPSGDRWIHEVKFDGYRVQVHLRDPADPQDAALRQAHSAQRHLG